ncbi:MAG: hypothetical protein ACPG21_06895 [Crocinitomicaceae bacterium]
MAGGKQTPRQKMIGMMYLVLTALLVLNVTKEVVNAFVTINDKLDQSATIIDDKVNKDYLAFEMKRMTLIAKKADLIVCNMWKSKADTLRSATGELVSYLLHECNDMIKEVEGEDWIAQNGIDENGNITQLRPLMDISVKDNYDVPTQLFIGGNPEKPIERGLEIRERIHAYRNKITQTMGTYIEKNKKWTFKPPKEMSQLSEALLTANPRDTAYLAHFYKSLSIPETLYDSGEEKDMPWVSVTFNQAPLVAAAMFTSLKVDIKNAESIASGYMLAKIDEPPYPINKIEPMAKAPTAYMNMGDSMNLNVLIAAYDSTEVYKIKWGMDADTIPERWKETTGGINLHGAALGPHRVKGAIGVRERGGLVWKPWSFDYTVGQPMGVVSQPNMRILYRGYPNELEATASGFPADKVSLRGSGCTIRKQGGKWIASPVDGSRTATINVIAQKSDGSSLNLGSYEYKVKGLPEPKIMLGSIKNGDNVSRSTVLAQNRLRGTLGPEVNLTNVNYTITGGTVKVEDVMRTGRVNRGETLDSHAQRALRQSSGKTVMIMVDYSDPSGVVRKGAVTFTVR